MAPRAASTPARTALNTPRPCLLCRPMRFGWRSCSSPPSGYRRHRWHHRQRRCRLVRNVNVSRQDARHDVDARGVIAHGHYDGKQRRVRAFVASAFPVLVGAGCRYDPSTMRGSGRGMMKLPRYPFRLTISTSSSAMCQEKRSAGSGCCSSNSFCSSTTGMRVPGMYLSSLCDPLHLHDAFDDAVVEGDVVDKRAGPRGRADAGVTSAIPLEPREQAHRDRASTAGRADENRQMPHSR